MKEEMEIQTEYNKQKLITSERDDGEKKGMESLEEEVKWKDR